MIGWPVIRWPKWLGPMPGRREAHALSWMAIATGLILCGISIVLGLHGRTFLGRPLGGDFVEFYTIGKILNEYAPARVYDLDLAVRLQHQILPSMSPTQMLVFGQAPYIGWLFRPFALLPYAWAYVAWLGFSAALYLAGLAALFSAAHLTPQDRKTGYLLAISWAPFLFQTWIGGQMSVVIFFLWAVMFWCLENQRPLLAGVALSLCVFKPTLVALPAVMLLAGRRWRAVTGLILGGAAAALISFAAVGLDGLRAWSAILALDAKFDAKTGDAWHRAKYVDFTAFFHLLVGSGEAATVVLMTATAMVAVGLLGRAWWRSGNGLQNELWAATVCFTLVVSAYTPIYDTVLVVAAVALVVSREKSEQHGEAFATWLLLLYMTPWFTQTVAEVLHLQLITLVLAAFGFWAWHFASERKGNAAIARETHPNPWEEEGTTPRRLEPRVAGRI